MPINTLHRTLAPQQWESQLSFPAAFVWLDGVFVVLHEDGSVELDNVSGSTSTTLSYQALRTLLSWADQFMRARERRKLH